MNNKLLALAVASALAPALAFADESTVTVYGKISLGVDAAKAEGCTTNAAGACTGALNAATGSSTGVNLARRARVSDNASYIGFRGVEPLGGNLSAFFQVESLVKLDSPPGRVTAANTNTFANRNSGVGLRGPFGEILLGRWDVYYTNHVPAGDALFVKSGYNATILALFGATSTMGGLASALVATTPAAGFVAANAEGRGLVDAGGRRDNVVRYVTPNLAGFTGKLTYVTPEATVTIPTNTPFSNAGKGSDKGIEVSVTYLNPNLGFANYSYYKRDDYGVGTIFGAIGNDSKSQKLAIGTKLAGFTVGLIGEKVEHENPATIAFTAVDREVKKYGIFVAYETGPWAFGTSFARAKDVEDNTGANCVQVAAQAVSPLSSCSGTGAKFYQATVNYNFSKRTTLFGTYSKIRNDANAAYDFFAQAAVSDSGPAFLARGADPEVLMIGISHFF